LHSEEFRLSAALVFFVTRRPARFYRLVELWTAAYRSQKAHFRPHQEADAATASAARSRGCGCTARAGSEVRTTYMVRVAGSAHAMVPVDPVCPKVFSEQPLLPANKPTFQPNP